VGGGGMEGGEDGVKFFMRNVYGQIRPIQGSKPTKMKGILKHKS